MFRHIVGLFWVVSLFAFSAPSWAGVTVIQALNFGEFIVRNNDSPHTITVNTGGPYSFSAGFLEINPTAQPGIYDVDGLPANTAIMSVVITQTSPLAGSGENLQMSAFQETHPASTNGAGVAQIRVGGTATTSGNGNPYLDQSYTGQLQIQINF